MKLTFRITHEYSTLKGFFGVRTSYNLEELNYICAYLQLVRYDLPLFGTVDDVLGEDDVVAILGQFYDCLSIVSQRPPSDVDCYGVVELYSNWEHYAVGADRKKLHLLAGMRGVQFAVVDRMLLQARKHANDESGRLYVSQLEFIRNGGVVPEEWKLATLEPKSIYTGSICLL